MRSIRTNCFGICVDGVSVETGKSHRAVVMTARERATRTGAALEEENRRKNHSSPYRYLTQYFLTHALVPSE